MMKPALIPLLLLALALAPLAQPQAQAPAQEAKPPWDRPVLQRRTGGPRGNAICPAPFWEALPQVTLAPQVTVQAVHFTGADHAQPGALEKIAARYRGKTLPSTGWTEELADAVRDAEQQQGYFCARAETVPKVLSGSSLDQQQLAVTVRVWEGDQYRLKLYLWRDARAFQPEQLAGFMPLRPGEVFDTHRIREGLETLRRAYAERGYLNFAAVPETTVDPERRTVELTLDLLEGRVYRLRKVEILGLEAELTQRLLRWWKPRVGHPYDARSPERFYQEFKSQLPAGVRRPGQDDRELRQDDDSGSIDLVLDFRRSS